MQPEKRRGHVAQELYIAIRLLGRVAVFDLHGDVTMLAEGDLTRAYHQAADTGARDIVLNFARAEYINSAGIAVIISVLTEARARGITIMISGLSPHYQKVFRMVGLTQYADVFDTDATAVHDLQGRASVEPA